MARSRTSAESFTSFCQKIETIGALPRLIFFIGENQDDLNTLLDALRTRLKSTFGSIDEVHIAGTDNEIARWHAEMMTMPMFPTGRLILVRHADALLKRIAANSKATANYLRDISQSPDFTVSVLFSTEKKLPTSLAAIEDEALIYEDTPLTGEALANSIAERLQNLGFKIERDALERLLEKSAGIQKTALQALDRLVTFKLHEKEIRIEDVEEVMSQAESNMHFRLLDATARRNTAECLRLLELHSMENIQPWINALGQLFANALRYRHYRQGGLDETQIGQLIYSRTPNRYAFQQDQSRWNALLQKYSIATIESVLEALVRADILCKETSDLSQQRVILTSFYLMLSRN